MEIAKHAKNLHEKNIQIYNVKDDDPITKTADGKGILELRNYSF